MIKKADFYEGSAKFGLSRAKYICLFFLKVSLYKVGLCISTSINVISPIIASEHACAKKEKKNVVLIEVLIHKPTL